MIPAADGPFSVATITAQAADPVVQRYRAFFALLDWDQVPERDAQRPWPGSPPHPKAAYIKALLVKLCEGKRYITDLRTYLLDHPLLALALGFRPVPDPAARYGFDVGRTVPCDRWLRHQQQTLDPTVLGALLAGTVRALQAEIPDLGTTIAVDVTHLYAWVRENNPKETIPHRYDPTRQPRGDPDCRLGVKRRTNRDGARGRRVEKEYLWGYGSGVASATDPAYGDVVLAELSLPFNHQDIVWFHPLYDRAAAVLGHPPTNLAADAAFDAWHVYHTCAAPRGGWRPSPATAAVPLRRATLPGIPICAHDRTMTPTTQFVHEDGFRAQRFRCPLLRPQPTGESCDHPRFAKGGCTKYTNLEHGGRMRAELDRQSAAYRAIYRQRTSTERINSQAKALGIERPPVRNGGSVHRLTTLTYIVINARALQRVRARKMLAHAPPPIALC